MRRLHFRSQISQPEVKIFKNFQIEKILKDSRISDNLNLLTRAVVEKSRDDDLL